MSERETIDPEALAASARERRTLSEPYYAALADAFAAAAAAAAEIRDHEAAIEAANATLRAARRPDLLIETVTDEVCRRTGHASRLDLTGRDLNIPAFWPPHRAEPRFVEVLREVTG